MNILIVFIKINLIDNRFYSAFSANSPCNQSYHDLSSFLQEPEPRRRSIVAHQTKIDPAITDLKEQQIVPTAPSEPRTPTPTSEEIEEIEEIPEIPKASPKIIELKESAKEIKKLRDKTKMRQVQQAQQQQQALEKIKDYFFTEKGIYAILSIISLIALIAIISLIVLIYLNYSTNMSIHEIKKDMNNLSYETNKNFYKVNQNFNQNFHEVNQQLYKLNYSLQQERFDKLKMRDDFKKERIKTSKEIQQLKTKRYSNKSIQQLVKLYIQFSLYSIHIYIYCNYSI